MSKQNYPQSVLRPINSTRAQPVTLGGFHLPRVDSKEEYTQLLTGLSAEQDVLLASFEKTEVSLLNPWRAIGSMT